MRGKKIADDILLEIRKKILEKKRHPGLAAILIGDDPASKLYIKNKEKACIRVGINFHSYLCGNETHPDISEDEIIRMIEYLNNDPAIDGIIVQLPIPKKYNTQKIINSIDPKKDVDGFHPENYKKFLKGESTYIPPLISSIVTLLIQYNVNITDKKIIVVSNSDIFSKGLNTILKKQKAKVDVVKSTDKNIREKMLTGDVIVSIVGKPNFITGSMIKKDAVVIDVGITLKDDEFLGDVNFDSVSKKASLITPTPGGVGPLTVAMLLKNTLKKVS